MRSLLHPLTLSLVVTAVLAWIFFGGVPRYELAVAEHTHATEDFIIVYDDVDGNGFGDKLVFEAYGDKRVAVTLHFNPSKAQREWHFRGKYNFFTDQFPVTGDYNNDRIKEVGMFSVSGDSLFLNLVPGSGGKNPEVLSRFICLTDHDTTGKGLHLGIIPGGWEDLNRDGYKEFIFATMFGYSSKPRNIYACDIRYDSLMVSPANGYHILQLLPDDLNGDGIREILVNGYASQTHKDSARFATHDNHCWLLALDRNLHYLFPPVAFGPDGYGKLTSLPISTPGGIKRIFSVYCPPPDSGQPPRLITFSSRGQVLTQSTISGVVPETMTGLFPFVRKGKPLLAVVTGDSGILVFDTALNRSKRIFPDFKFENAETRLDADGDGNNEIVGFDFARNRMVVTRSDMTHPAFLSLNLEAGRDRNTLSLYQRPGKRPLLSLTNGRNIYLIEYRGNAFWYLRWLAAAGIFLAVYLFALLIGRMQRIRIERRRKIEKKITELQLKIVRNQMDPHFTMNAINAVVDAVNREEKEQAREHLLHFSKMYRSLVLSADQIKRTLKEELDFAENYLALEKFRFGDRFSYSIEIADEVDLSRDVPKMAIQSPVENAVKHGFSPPPPLPGVILIHAFMEGPSLVIEITDNGMGRAAAGKAGSAGTGKGMEIMEQFFALYRKVTGFHVTSEVSDLADDQGNPAGTKVRVTVPGER